MVQRTSGVCVCMARGIRAASCSTLFQGEALILEESTVALVIFHNANTLDERTQKFLNSSSHC